MYSVQETVDLEIKMFFFTDEMETLVFTDEMETLVSTTATKPATQKVEQDINPGKCKNYSIDFGWLKKSVC